MGFRTKLFITCFLIFADLVSTTVRPTWDHGGAFEQYIWVAAHLMIAFLEGVMVFAFFSGTIWFTAGLLGEMLFTVKTTLPLWLIRTFFVQMPWTYNTFVNKNPKSPWEDAGYAALFSLDITFAILFWVSLIYTISCLTDKRMYAPYHREVCMALIAQYHGKAKPIQTSLSGSGGGGAVGPSGGVNPNTLSGDNALRGSEQYASPSLDYADPNRANQAPSRRTVVTFA
jgi:hypothetical protein